MPTEGDDAAGLARALQAAMDEVLPELPGQERAHAPEAVDYHWLGLGMRLGLDRPQQARHLLELIGAREADRAALSPGSAEGAPGADVPATDVPATDVPVGSALLARAAAVPPADRASLEPEEMFRWAAALTSAEILSLGRVVQDMLAAGSPADIDRGFGIAWDAGAHLPQPELRVMFKEFTELEITVGSVLAGHDLRRGEPVQQSRGLFGALLGPWASRTRPGESQAAAELERSGEPARRGLVALWNVWVAMRYRELIPRSTFDLLVHPWVTVVGPLPGA
jgi:hypothetical protein